MAVASSSKADRWSDSVKARYGRDANQETWRWGKAQRAEAEPAIGCRMLCDTRFASDRGQGQH